MALLFAAPRPLVVATLCLIGVAQGLSLVQLKADARLSSSSVEDGQDGPPDASEIMSVLENINGSLDKVEEVVTTANSTAYSMVDGFMQAIVAMQDSLAALSTAAASASVVPGAEDVETQVNNFIGKANATLQKVQAKVPATLDKFSAKLATIVPELTKVGDKAFSQFVDALNIIVNDIYNNSAVDESMRSIERESHKAGNADRHASKGSIKEVAHKARNAHKHASKESDEEGPHSANKAHRHVGKASAAEAVALLRERVFQDLQPSSASNVDGAILKKGKTPPPKKAMRETKQANATLGTLFDKIAKTNSTVADLLYMVLDAASAAIDDINATVAPALADLPGPLAQPVSSALDTLLTTKDSMASDVQSKVGELEGIIQAALEMLAEVVPLADEFLAAIDEAGAAESTATAGADAGDSNATSETDATDSTSTAAPEAETGTSTAAPDAAESSSTAAPEVAENTSTAAPEVADSTSTAVSDAAESTSTAAPDAAESTSTAAPEMTENTSTAAPEVADSTSTGVSDAPESTSTAAPDAAESTSTAAPEMTENTSTAAPEVADSTSTGVPDAAASTTAAPDAAASTSSAAPDVVANTSTLAPNSA